MNPEFGYQAIAILALLLFLRVPIGFALIGVSSFGIWYLRGANPALGTLGGTPFNFVAHWTLSAVPMFVFMGAVASRTGITTGLYDAIRVWTERLPGGLAIATSITGAGFAAICGSSFATTAAMGRIAVPEMLRAGYDIRLATGAAAAVGTIGALIPPSIIMVIYAIFAEISVGKMLIAGIVPGLLTAFCYAVLIYVRCRINPELGPLPGGPRTPMVQKVRGLKDVLPVAAIAVIVIGAIYGGFATATEAGAVGAAMTVLVALAQRRLGFAVMLDSAKETASTAGSVFIIAIGATMMTQFLSLTGMSSQVSSFVTELTSQHVLIILLCCALYLVMGAFLDPLGIMLLTLPILLPVFKDAGINQIWAGVILVKMLEIGLLTPPVGLNVFIMKNVMGDRATIGQVFSGVSWFLLAEVVVMALLIGFPSFILVLPGLMD